ncbi:hypothetical protein Sango_0719600 [Sesamum angolense]|uniref:Uncharacterized protein n=1 Tax=Sesamum angolense TaxID=2727404 RepID=A0AAE1X1C2_9LAMI|nr:hypothetical protein Sango_0719600 [Sesamum angolense]
MPFPIPTLIVQSASAIYNPCKDLLQYINGKKHDIEELEDNLTKLLEEVIIIQSRKNDFDRELEGLVFKEKNNEYQIVEKQIEIIHKRFTKFITKYQKVTTDLASVVPQLDALRELRDEDTLKAKHLIDELQKRKPKILTSKFFKLAQLSRDIVKLTKDAREVRDSVKQDNLLVEKKLEVVQVQHTDKDLPLNDRYVADLVRYLSDQNAKRIGITGPVGVGKTTVLKKLNNQLENTTSLSYGNNSFRLEIVIWIPFPKELGTEEMIIEKIPDEENCVIWVPWDNELLSEEIWRKATRLSFICCNSELPEIPGSSNLSTLLLQRNPELVSIGALFFRHMRNLLVLDLHKTGIKTLPESISSLVSLVSLYLNNCSQLAKLPAEVKGLKQLELLDIRGTSIPAKEKQGCLMIPPNIICRLQNLEEFTIETGCCNQGWINIADHVVHELASLHKLTTLSFHFPSVRSLKMFVNDSKSWKNTKTHWENNTLRSFKISIGFSGTKHPYSLDFSGLLDERLLRFLTSGEISSVKEVLKQASAFELVGHSVVESLSEFDLENTGALKVCVVECCNKLLNIVDPEKTDERLEIREEHASAVLQCLEKLHLFDLLSLQSIWKGSVLPGSLSNLKVLTLFGCPKLTEILNHKLAKALSSLEHLKVENFQNYGYCEGRNLWQAGTG